MIMIIMLITKPVIQSISCLKLLQNIVIQPQKSVLGNT